MYSIKGITPVVAVIMLLLIVIAVVGGTYTFIQRTMQSTQNQTSQQIQHKLGQITTSFRIASVSGNKIYLRNTGTGPLDTTKFGVYVDGKRILPQNHPTIDSGKVAALRFDRGITGNELRVTSSLKEDNINPPDELLWYDDFCENTESEYVKTEHASRGSLTNGGWIIDEDNCELHSDTSNSDLTIHTKPSLTKDIEDVHVSVEYLGTDDNDGSGPLIYDGNEGRWWVGSITNNHGCNGIGYIEGGNVNCVASGDNWDTTQEHTFDLHYWDGVLKFYVDGQKSAEHTVDISPDAFGVLSDAQNPPAYYDSIEVRAP